MRFPGWGHGVCHLVKKEQSTILRVFGKVAMHFNPFSMSSLLYSSFLSRNRSDPAGRPLAIGFMRDRHEGEYRWDPTMTPRRRVCSHIIPDHGASQATLERVLRLDTRPEVVFLA